MSPGPQPPLRKRNTMSNKSIKSVSFSASSSVAITAAPLASVDDTAAYLRDAPLIMAVLNVALPTGVPARGALFAQQELRKLDADLGPDTNLALKQLVTLGPAALEADLGPTVKKLRGVEALIQRRVDSALIVTRLRALLHYAETIQRLADHDAVLMMDAVGEAVAFLGQYDDSLHDRYRATLDVLAARNGKIAEGRARSRTPDPATR